MTTHGFTILRNDDASYTVTYPWGESTYTKEFGNLASATDFIWNVAYDRETFEAVKGAIEEMVNPTTETPAFEIPADTSNPISILNMLYKLDWLVCDLKSTPKYKELEDYAESVGFTLDFDKEQDEFTVTKKRIDDLLVDNITIENHIGTWYVIDKMEHDGETVYLLEHEEYGDEVACLIVNREKQVICDDVWNGFDDLDYLD